MIGIIAGEKGTGKTKKILEHANNAIRNAKGSIVFIDEDNSYMFDLPREIRFINASEYGICSSKMLYGMLCGVAAQDFDLECIYVDSFLSFVHHSLEELKPFFDAAEEFSNKRQLDLILSISSAKEELPAYLKEMVLV